MSYPATPNSQSLDQITKATGLGAFVIGGGSQGGGTQWGQTVDGNLVSSLTMGGLLNVLSGGIADTAAAIEKVSELLLTLPLEVLQAMQQVIPGAIPSQFVDVTSAVTTIMQSIATPVFTLFDTFTQFVQAILNALTGGGLTGSLETLVEQIPVIGQVFQGFADMTGLLGNPTGLGTGSPTIPGLGSIPLLGGLLSGGLLDPTLLGSLPTEVQQIFEIVQGILVTPISSGVQFFKDWFTGLTGQTQNLTPGGLFDASAITDLGKGLMPANLVQGFTGLVNVLETFGNMTDGLGTAFTPGGSTVSGLGFPDLFTLAQQQTENAMTALEHAISATLQLGNRVNKPTSAGMNPTSEAMFGIGHFVNAAQTGQATTTIATGTGLSQVFRPLEPSKKGFIQTTIKGNGAAGVFVNMFKIGTGTTPTRTQVYSSGDIGTTLNTTAPAHVRSLIPGGVQMAQGDQYQLEIFNNTGSPLTVVAKDTFHPNDPYETIQNYGATRSTGGTAPATVAHSSFAPTSLTPFFNVGIQDVPADYHAPQRWKWDPPAGANPPPVPAAVTWTPATDAPWLRSGDAIDLVGIGGGGSGAGSNYGDPSGFAPGGSPGAWQGIKLIYGVDVKIGTSISIQLGRGGLQSNGYSNPGKPGQATTFTWTKPDGSTGTLTCAGGIGGPAGVYGGDYTGIGAGNFTFDTQSYYGGGNVGADFFGSPPGGGGGGGSWPYTFGAPGSGGGANVYAKQAV